jgi:ATP-dependent helicase HrpB
MALPIEEVLGDVRAALQHGRSCILVAPPGAGKTTMVPTALLDEPWLGAKKVLMLEPRRVAATAAARRMSVLRNEKVGTTIGYRMRMESCVGPHTRIEVITEGILTRQLTHDPMLNDIGVVIFDEFHERSLNADVGLALARLTQQLLRPDLRIIVMSATLNIADVARVLDDAQVIESMGRTYPVDVTWQRSHNDEPLPARMASAIGDAVRSNTGDILCFLPGQAELRRTSEQLERTGAVGDRASVHMLHGDLALADQDAILRPASAQRRVILATAIAETSLTIDGVTTVIDGGMSREPRFDARSGMSHLTTVPASRDAAEQRRGRAGRTGPGRCVRLWTELEHQHLPQHRTPEILVADCTSLLLDVAAYGIALNDVPWIDPPPAAHVAHAEDLLRQLGAHDGQGAITPHGRELLRYGVHPRVAHMIVTAAQRGISSELAFDVATLIGERDLLRAPDDARLARRIDVLNGLADDRTDRGRVAHARTRRKHFRTHTSSRTTTAASQESDIGVLLALAYPDRVARRKSDGRFVMRNGRTARIASNDTLAASEWLAIGELDGSQQEPRIVIAEPLATEQILDIFRDAIVARATVGWSDRDGRIVARTERMLGAIRIDLRDHADVDEEELARAFARELAVRELNDLPWSDAAVRLCERVAFCRHHELCELPDLSRDGLRGTAEEWLAPHLHGMRTLGELRQLDLATILGGMLSFSQRSSMDRAAPEFYRPPKGREVVISYADPERPRVSVRLQFLFGVTKTPLVALGNIALTIELLSPANRPIQVTQDLAGFWKGSYAQVRREMKGRYPKHDWPE